MRILGMNGTISAVIAVGVVLLIVFSANASLGIGETTRTVTKIEAARETALRTENAIGILDKATSRATFDNVRFFVNPCITDSTSLTDTEVNNEFASALAVYTTGSAITCSTTPPGISYDGQNSITVSGTLTCSTQVNGVTFSDSSNYKFRKQSYDAGGGNCKVRDLVSGCTEWQGATPKFDASSCP